MHVVHRNKFKYLIFISCCCTGGKFWSHFGYSQPLKAQEQLISPRACLGSAFNISHCSQWLIIPTRSSFAMGLCICNYFGPKSRNLALVNYNHFVTVHSIWDLTHTAISHKFKMPDRLRSRASCVVSWLVLTNDHSLLHIRCYLPDTKYVNC